MRVNKGKVVLAAAISWICVAPCMADPGLLIAELVVRTFPWCVVVPAYGVAVAGSGLYHASSPAEPAADGTFTNAVVASTWTPLSLDVWNYGNLNCAVPWCPADVYGLDLGLVGSSCDELAGIQANPFFAHARRSSGWQCSGCIARTDTEADGIFLGGLAGGAGHVRGVLASGVLAHSFKVEGCQIAPVDIARGEMDGVQMGLVNYGSGVCGIQCGCFNFCERLSGAQFGVVNSSGKCGWGFQLGVFNILDSGNAIQVGVINRILFPSALQFGLLNFSCEERWFAHRGPNGADGSARSTIGMPIVNFGW